MLKPTSLATQKLSEISLLFMIGRIIDSEFVMFVDGLNDSPTNTCHNLRWQNLKGATTNHELMRNGPFGVGGVE